MSFNITFMLFVIGVLLAGILVAIMAYPGPKRTSRKAKVR